MSFFARVRLFLLMPLVTSVSILSIPACSGGGGIEQRGPPGASGAQGASGPTGAMGPSGATGPTGTDGLPGAMGATGATGIAGGTGATGADGIKGPTGAYAFVWQGPWQSTVPYSYSDAVQYEGSTWYCIASNLNAAPSVSPQNWALLAAAGSTGPTGPTGSTVGASSVIDPSDPTGRRRLAVHPPETPESYLMDYGQGQLVGGVSHVELDPIFAANVKIDLQHPLRAFVQIVDNDDSAGVSVKNRTTHGFDVVERQGGRSNLSFLWQVVCNRADEVSGDGRPSQHTDVRFEPFLPPERFGPQAVIP